MVVKDCAKNLNGFQYVIENVQVCSSLGKTLLMNQPFLTQPQMIETEMERMERHLRFLCENENTVRQLVILLHEINDFSQTIRNLKHLQVLDDIEFFEIKKFALTSQKISEVLANARYEQCPLTDLSKVVSMLDPEDSRIAHFYIYSAYDTELEKIRKELASETDADRQEELRWKAAQAEDAIRQKLTEMLHPYWESLQKNMLAIGSLDVLNAKAQMAQKWHLSRPSVATTESRFHSLFHPEIRNRLQQRDADFQPVDISLSAMPCLITGANMSGKTVLLKSLSLAQHMFQFGFYVPAATAEIVPVEEVHCVIDDQQTEQRGLSSFAAEMVAINEILQQAKRGTKMLVLVDELARTTNPDEGRRIVSAFIRMMQKYGVMALVTTHYGGINAPCRRLRVKGLKTNEITDNITPGSLNRYMDYSLQETTSDEVPAEALSIARIFHVDDEFLALASEN